MKLTEDDHFQLTSAAHSTSANYIRTIIVPGDFLRTELQSSTDIDCTAGWILSTIFVSIKFQTIEHILENARRPMPIICDLFRTGRNTIWILASESHFPHSFVK